MNIRSTFLPMVAALLALPLLAQETPSSEYWSHAFRLPDEVWKAWSTKDKRAKRGLKKPGSHIEVCAPEGATQLRAVMLIPNNTDSVHIGEHPAVRKVAEKHKIGIVFLKSFSGAAIERADPPELAEQSFDAVLAKAAEATGIEDFKHAPG